MKPLPPVCLNAMEQLATYRYLTSNQLVRLGVSKRRSSLYSKLRELTDRGRPLAQKITFGVDAYKGQLPAIYYLTPAGVDVAECQLGLSREDIKYPMSKANFFAQYYHTVATIDTHISARLWAQHHDLDVMVFDTYHEVIKQGKEKASAKTQFYLHDGTRVIPDANMMFELNGQSSLYVIEIYKGNHVARTVKQLKKHLIGLAHLSASKKYGMNVPYRILVVFLDEVLQQGVIKRLHNAPAFTHAIDYFLLKHIDQINDPLQSFYYGWRNLRGEERDLI